MKANIISRAFYDLKHQPVIGIVTLAATALSIFLIMIVVMMHSVEIAPFSPESNRERTLYGKFIHLKHTRGSSSSAMTYYMAKRLYGDLADADVTTFYGDAERIDLSLLNGPSSFFYRKRVDDKFWNVFDYDLLAGRLLDESDVESGALVAVVSETVARTVLGTVDDAPGREILLSQRPYTVVGVVADVSPLAKEAFAEVLIPLSAEGHQKDSWDDDKHFGPYACAILAESPAKFDAIRAEVQQRKQIFNTEAAADSLEIIDHGSPFTQEEVSTVKGSNGDPDRSGDTRRLLIYAILLIVPAINLSSMTQSRLRRRTAELGVRRAFGCTRSKLILDILIENIIITLAGGLAGLIMSIVFGYFLGDMLFTDIDTSRTVNMTMEMLLNYRVFGMALLFCFILDLLSCGIPAWRASRTDVVAALNSRNI